jgi:predicted dehydrogenase
MEKVKVSVIGTGHLGSIHAKLWKSTPHAELIGIFDVDKENALKVSKENDIKIFNKIEDAILSSDAVTIAAPTSLHFEIAMKCIENKVHCFIEKPITTTHSEAEELISKAKENNVILQVGHVERFNPALMALSEYGLNPRFIEAHRLSQFKPRAIDVSVILDLMIHDIDIMLWLIKSKVSKIDANGVAVLTDTADIANARITFENGAVANLTASRISANPMRKMRIFQPNAYISIDFGRQDVEVFRILDDKDKIEGNAIPASMLGTLEAGLKNKKIIYEKPEVPEINAIAEEQKAFIETINGNLPIAVSAEEAAEALRIAELISEQIGK